MSAPAKCLTIGQKIGNYEVVRLIGEGAMGEVYEVADATLDRRAALKVVPPYLARDKSVVARFRQEARAASRVRHPGVVHIYEYGALPELGNAPYFIMEYLEGETLHTRLKRAARKPGGCLGMASIPLLRQLALALAEVHRCGLVHRDLKPSNVMLIPDPNQPGGERAKILDFGIVKILRGQGASPSDSHDGMTRAGLVLGTPRYMAPEQWKCGGHIDGKTDVYALGVITYVALTGELPFVAADAPELGMLHCYKPAPSLASVNPTLSPVLVDLVARMLEKDPERRPTMTQVAETLIKTQPRSGLFERLSVIFGTSDVEISVQATNESAEDLELDESDLEVQTAELTQPLPQIREKVTDKMSPVPLPPGVNSLISLYNSKETSEGSLPVGSNDNWRAPASISTWIAGAAAFVLLVSAVHFVISHRGTRGTDTNATAPIAAAKPVSAVTADKAPADDAPPVSQSLGRGKKSKKKARVIPDLSCVKNANWNIDQQKMLLRAFARSETKLRPDESLILIGLHDSPSMRKVPRSLSRHARADLMAELRRISGLFTSSVPAQVEIRCPLR